MWGLVLSLLGEWQRLRKDLAQNAFLATSMLMITPHTVVILGIWTGWLTVPNWNSKNRAIILITTLSNRRGPGDYTTKSVSTKSKMSEQPPGSLCMLSPCVIHPTLAFSARKAMMNKFSSIGARLLMLYRFQPVCRLVLLLASRQAIPYAV